MDSDQELKAIAQAKMLANRVKKRLKHLQKWAKRMNFEAFRLYDRDIPEIPLVLDLYGGVISGALYKRPYEKDPAEEALWLESMRTSLSQSLNIAPENIIIKQRERQKGGNQYERIAEKGLTREIREGNYKFKVNLSDYLDTGLFLDRRSLRNLVGADAKGKRVLNLFSYTASFSVYAAGSGAISTDSVDLSNTYLAWARENFALNGFEAVQMRPQEFFAQSGFSTPHSPVGAAQSAVIGPKTHPNRLIRADVNAFLEHANIARYTWDSIILDPPAFSNSTMASADFDLAKDYPTLLANCLALLSPGGKLWFSASAKSFKADAAELEITLNGKYPGLKVVDISGEIVDEDFKGKTGPKTFIITGTRD
jgi:23S rRNA G2069 N7-methylase RlmK/C1962 C5-methylase RlmI